MPITSAMVGQSTTTSTEMLGSSSSLLKELVFDHLYHNGYSRTAEVFLQDSGVFGEAGPSKLGRSHSAMDVDSTAGDKLGRFQPVLESMAHRSEILLHILSGRISEARTLLDQHFPYVLSQDELIDPADDPAPSVYPAHITSHNPIHLSLNLRIHAFIERFRTRPLDFPPSQGRPSTPLPDLAGAARIASANGSSSDPEHSAQEELLKEAHRLYHDATSLEDEKDRATYQKEMQNVGALLAYTIPENSPRPVAKYLSQERRQAVADQINSAILYKEKLPPTSRIAYATQQTSLVYSLLHETGAVLPPPSVRPRNVYLPSVGPPARNRKGKEDIQEYDCPVPRFDLAKFLDDKPSNRNPA